MRRRLAFLVMLAAGAALYFTLAPRWPKDQTLHVVLGAAAPRVTEVGLRYGNAGANAARGRDDPDRGAHQGDAPPAEDWTREVTFRYALMSAPRVITHAARLPDGDYLVEIDLTTPTERTTVQRRIRLAGGVTAIDVAESLPVPASRGAEAAP